MCNLGPSSAISKMGLIDMDLQDHFVLERVNFCKFELVRAPTHQVFEIESPFLHKMCILCIFCALLKMGLIEGASALAHAAVPQEGDPDLCGNTESIMVNSTLHRSEI